MKILALIGGLAILIAIGTAVFFFGGFYSVAGTAQDPAIIASALIRVRQASISHHATDIPPMSLDDPAVVGGGCACLRYARLRELPRRAGREVGDVLRRPEPQPA